MVKARVLPTTMTPPTTAATIQATLLPVPEAILSLPVSGYGSKSRAPRLLVSMCILETRRSELELGEMKRASMSGTDASLFGYDTFSGSSHLGNRRGYVPIHPSITYPSLT